MGLTVLDAGVIMPFLDDDDGHHGAAEIVLGDALERNDRLVLPASAWPKPSSGHPDGARWPLRRCGP